MTPVGIFIQLAGFSQLVYWSGLPFPRPADHVLSEVSTVTCPSLVAIHNMAHSFIELCKPLRYTKEVIHELGQTPGDGEGQGSLACCSPWNCEELDTTWRLNNNSRDLGS